MLDNVELIMYMKFKKFVMTRCRDMDKKHRKYPKNGFFPHLWSPKIFFQKQALSLLYPYGAITSCNGLWDIQRRTNGQIDGYG